MKHKREIENLMIQHQRRLQKLMEQQARLGYDTPPSISTEIEDIKSEIKNLQIELRGLEIAEENGFTKNNAIYDDLAILPKLMEKTEIRAEVFKFRADLAAVHRQIDVLGEYKDLHDLLHDLQFRCYNVIVREAPRFPTEMLAHENLMSYEIVLEEIADRLQYLSKRPSLSEVDIYWIQDIRQAQEKLREAIEQEEEDSLEACIHSLKHIIALQPSSINQRLNTAFRGLHLDTLEQVMKSILAKMMYMDVDQAKVRQFEKGVAALSELSKQFADVVNTHDRWQGVERELNRIENVMEYTLKEVELSWSHLKIMVAPLCQESNESWINTLQQDGQKLDKALAEQNPAKIKLYFIRYRQRAGTRFFLVDKQLKEMCDELRKMSEPLTSILQTLR